MGMSASQARFLCLTARKNNVEFEGQQINQQRTTLSNESATYYSELCNMEVPTPPSIDDYTKVSYTFNDGAMTNTIISMLAKGNNEYSISYLEQWQDDYSIVTAASSLVARSGDATSGFKYSIGNSFIRPLMEIAMNTVYEEFFNGKLVKYDDEGAYIDEIVNNTNGDNTNPETENTSDNDNNKIDANNSGEYQFFHKGADGNAEGEGLVLIDGKYYFFSDLDVDGKTLLPNNRGEQPAPTDMSEYVVTNGELDENGKIIYYDYSEYEEQIVKNAQDEDSQESGDNTTPATTTGKHHLTPEEIEQIEKRERKVPDRTVITDPYLLSLSDEQLEDLLETEKYYNLMLKEKFGDDTEWQVRYIKNTTSGIYVPYFYKTQELEDGEKYNDKNLASISCFSLGSTTKTKEILNAKGLIEKDASGRYVAITLFDKDGNPTTYGLTTTTSTDEEAYNDAMNKYHFKQHEYDHKVQEINSKLEIIQTQDKQLELKLKQLDTEENAIQTEMDAVKKVISKNVESSFKTFNA